MSRGLGWLEKALLDYLCRQRGGTSFDALVGHTFEFNQWGSYQTRVGSVRRALGSLSSHGNIEERVYNGVIIYTVIRRQRSVPSDEMAGPLMGTAKVGPPKGASRAAL
jgi:hypothetical protein